MKLVFFLFSPCSCSLHFQIFCGTPPFANTLDHFLFALVVDRGVRPLRPTDPRILMTGLDDSMWSLIQECWAQEPSSRPAVSDVASRLGALQQLHSNAFSGASPFRTEELFPDSISQGYSFHNRGMAIPASNQDTFPPPQPPVESTSIDPIRNR
jgi:hypothetical protein